MSLLSKLLQKRGIKSENDLSIEEKAVFDKYKLILTGETVTIESLKEFCATQLKIIESKFATGDNSDKKDAYYKAAMHIYINLLQAINAPEIERAGLERYLNSLIAE